MVLQGTGLPSSQLAGFLNKVAFLAPNRCHLTHWLLCGEWYELGLGYTQKATLGCDLGPWSNPTPFQATAAALQTALLSPRWSLLLPHLQQ